MDANQIARLRALCSVDDDPVRVLRADLADVLDALDAAEKRAELLRALADDAAGEQGNALYRMGQAQRAEREARAALAAAERERDVLRLALDIRNDTVAAMETNAAAGRAAYLAVTAERDALRDEIHGHRAHTDRAIDGIRAALPQALAAAREDEREECAKIADETGTTALSSSASRDAKVGVIIASNAIAKSIRARGKDGGT